MGKYLFEDLTYRIIGSCLNLHKELGCGFLEAVYQEALEREFIYQSIPYKREVRLRIKYRGEPLSKEYQADFICFDKIILEIKALPELTTKHEAQVINYLKATGLKLGLLINFGSSSLENKRLIYTK
jgi:GxxExxY protein